MRVVADTNVLISFFLSRDSTPGQAVRTTARTGSLLFTEATLGELITVLYREKFDRYTTAELRRAFLHHLLALAEIVISTRPITACRDPNDNIFLEAVVHGEADYLITGDKDMPALHPFMGIPILTPAQFLKEIP